MCIEKNLQSRQVTNRKWVHENPGDEMSPVCLCYDSMTHLQSHTPGANVRVKVASALLLSSAQETCRSVVTFYSDAAVNLNPFCQKEWTGEHVFHLYHECTFPFDCRINVQHYLEQHRVYFTCSISQMPLAVELLPGGVSCNSENAFILKKGDNITVKFTGYWCHSGAAHLENLLVEGAAVFVFSGNRRSINMTSVSIFQYVMCAPAHVCNQTHQILLSPSAHVIWNGWELCHF